MDMLNGNLYGVQQNLYVQPPTRQQHNSLDSEKSNLMPRTTGRSRNPLLDVSLTQLDRPASPLNRNLNHSHESIGKNDDRNGLGFTLSDHTVKCLMNFVGRAGNLPPINHSHSSSHNINQENHDSITSQHTHLRSRSVVEDHQEPPRPPPPRPEGRRATLFTCGPRLDHMVLSGELKRLYRVTDYYGITKMPEDETSNVHRQKYPM